jgi:hypothetical protein
MRTTTVWCDWNLGLLVGLMLAIGEGVYAQTISQSGQSNTMATNNPFSTPSLTLTGALVEATGGSVPLAKVKETIQAALESKDYKTALDFAIIGLKVSPVDFQLLGAKAIALTRLHRLPEAIAAHRDALAVEPDNINAVCGLAELLLITGQIAEYRTLVAKYKPQIDTTRDGVISKYFSVLEAYWAEDKNRLRSVVTQSLKALPSRKGSPAGDWGFDEVSLMISQQPASPKKVMLAIFLRVLKGEVSRDVALQAIKKL